MGSFSALGIGLSFLFGCIFLGLVAELYYVLWWKKKFTQKEPQNHFTKHATDLPHLFCFKTHNCSLNKNSKTHQEQHQQDQDPELGLGLGIAIPKDLLKGGYGEEGVESELMRAHNLCGPPRFLFTIKEETKEDLDSIGTPLASISSPLASPPLKPHYLSSFDNNNNNNNNHHGFKFNPLFESSNEAEMNRFRSSPPPSFKFLRDAEEKLMKKLVEEAERKKIVVLNVQDSSGVIKASSQVLPLASSPNSES
ncbi:hypothetical protein LguiB_031209 [Lonicera macranthoides]